MDHGGTKANCPCAPCGACQWSGTRSPAADFYPLVSCKDLVSGASVPGICDRRQQNRAISLETGTGYLEIEGRSLTSHGTAPKISATGPVTDGALESNTLGKESAVLVEASL